MISVTVQRDPANRRGPDISDPLITSEAVAVERGRNEIDANCSQRQLVTLDVMPVAGVRVNSLVEVQGIDVQPWRGMVTAIAIRVALDGDQLTRTMTLTVEREAI